MGAHALMRSEWNDAKMQVQEECEEKLFEGVGQCD